MKALQCDEQQLTPMELPGEDRGGDPSPRPGMRERERERERETTDVSKNNCTTDYNSML